MVESLLFVRAGAVAGEKIPGSGAGRKRTGSTTLPNSYRDRNVFSKLELQSFFWNLNRYRKLTIRLK